MVNKTSNNQQQRKTKWKNQSIMIVNRKAKTTRPITLEVLVQEKNGNEKEG